MAGFYLAYLTLVVMGTTAVLDNISILAIPLPVLAIALSAIGGYDHRSDMMSLQFTSLYLITFAVASPICLLLVYLFGTYGAPMQPSRALLPIALAYFAVTTLFARRWLIRWASAPQHASGKFLVLGSEEELRAFRECPHRAAPGEEFDYVDTQANSGSEWLRGVTTGYDAIIVAGSMAHLPPELTMSLVSIHFHRLPVYTVETFFEDHCRRVYLPRVSPEWLFHDKFLLTRKSVFCHVKRGLDIVLSGIFLLISLPAILLLSAAIRLESKGSPIFLQPRIGRNGIVFSIFKLRTMKLAREDGPLYTSAQDSRITRLGGWLRKTRIDELPQLWNVLRGEMSLIGPRAEWTRCAEIYENQIPNYHLRHLVRPGITGWAQVNYPYGESLEDAVQKLSYDLYYIRHFSPLLDGSITLKTIYLMLFGKGR